MPTSALDIIDSAVKIGLGALISGIATYSVTKLKFRHEIQQNVFTRRRDILEAVAEDLERFNESSHECSHAIFGVVKGTKPPSELNIAATGLSKGLNHITKSLAKTQLLGESEVGKFMASYKDTAVQLYNFVNNCGSKDPSDCDLEEYNNLIDELSKSKSAVMDSLRKSYLSLYS